MCLFRETYLYNTSNKTNSTWEPESRCHLYLLPKIPWGRGEKKTNCRWQSLSLRCTERFKSKSRFPSKCLFILPGRRCHAIWHSRPVKDILLRINAEQRASLFYPFMQNWDINVSLDTPERHLRLENEIQKWDLAGTSFHGTWLNNTLLLTPGIPTNPSNASAKRLPGRSGREGHTALQPHLMSKGLEGLTPQPGLWSCLVHPQPECKASHGGSQLITGCWTGHSGVFSLWGSFSLQNQPRIFFFQVITTLFF